MKLIAFVAADAFYWQVADSLRKRLNELYAKMDRGEKVCPFLFKETNEADLQIRRLMTYGGPPRSFEVQWVLDWKR